MPIEATPITPATGDGAYLSVDEARALAATLPMMTSVVAQTDEALGMLLLLASVDLDRAMRYQGSRFVPEQVREFPRLPHGIYFDRNCGAFPGVVYGPGFPLPEQPVIWDWDATNKVAVVPDAVKIACLFQVAWLLDSKHAQRLEAIRSGLAAQSIGSASETYLNPATMPESMTGLSDRASRLMERYRLKTGKML